MGGRKITFLGLFFLLCQQVSDAQAPSVCGPVFKAAVMSVSSECINDTVALITHDSSDSWLYAPDSATDGVTGDRVGIDATGVVPTFEVTGMAFRETSEFIYVVLAADMDEIGVPEDSGPLLNGSVSFGDLFINFSGKSLHEASRKGILYAVRFNRKNDSFVPELGVYSNVTATTVSYLPEGLDNEGYFSFASYEQAVKERGGIVSYGDLGTDTQYFGVDEKLNVIESGTFLGAIELLNREELTAQAFDFSRIPARYYHAFKFRKTLVIDQCGVPGGDGQSCLDCRGIACGGVVTDGCGVCGGDNSTCSDCEGIPNGTAAPGSFCQAGSAVGACGQGVYSSQCQCEPLQPLPVEEVCDGIDNDCDGIIDESQVCSTSVSCADLSVPGESCVTGLPGICSVGTVTNECLCAAPNGEREICDGIDNDCNGLADENGSCETSECILKVKRTPYKGLRAIGRSLHSTARVLAGSNKVKRGKTNLFLRQSKRSKMIIKSIVKTLPSRTVEFRQSCPRCVSQSIQQELQKLRAEITRWRGIAQKIVRVKKKQGLSGSEVERLRSDIRAIQKQSRKRVKRVPSAVGVCR